MPVSADATDLDGSVAQVGFFLDASVAAFHTDTDPFDGWGVDWDSVSVANGTHTITAVATDNEGATASARVSVTVSNGTSSILLRTSGKKVKGVMTATLGWEGAVGNTVDVWRNGRKIVSETNDGSHTDTIGKGSGSYAYQVCEVGSTTACSNESSVVF